MSSGFGTSTSEKILKRESKTIIKTINQDIKMFKIISYNKQGTLAKILQRISQYNFDFTNCESSFINNDIRHFELHLFIREHAKEMVLNETFMRELLDGLCTHVEEIGTLDLPEFPMKLEDLNTMPIDLQSSQDGLNDDHPGKNDKEYIKRRQEIGDFCLNYQMLDNIPRVNYTPQEKQLWTEIFEKLTPLIYEHGEKSFVENFKGLEKDHLFVKDDIPQLDEINKYLISKSNWRIKPVNGILSQRAYLNSLAFRTFCSTQYLRHHTKPFYTPEPDIFHEFFGHIPMFLNPTFCDVSQKLGNRY
jgi:phenylalanine-4-hydroxylase